MIERKYFTMKKIQFLLTLFIAIPAISLASSYSSLNNKSSVNLNQSINHDIQQMRYNRQINNASRAYNTMNPINFSSNSSYQQARDQVHNNLMHYQLQKQNEQRMYDLQNSINERNISTPASNSTGTAK